MPQGADRELSDASVAAIERWIKAGAGLDPGLDSRASFQTYAASPEELRRHELAKLSPSERDRKCEEAGRSRIARANPKLKPEITPSEHFLFFANLPKDRTIRAIKVLESQHQILTRLLGKKADWPEKVGVYLFHDRKDLIEFIRTVEEREVDSDVEATARLAVPQPYLAVLDSSGSLDESSAPARSRGGRNRKRGAGSTATTDLALACLMSETLVSGAIRGAGKPPGWLASGIGVFAAARVDPRSPRLRKLRAIVADASQQGWAPRALEVLADHPEVRLEEMQAIGYAFVDWMLSTDLRREFPEFVNEMLKESTTLADALRSVYQSDRDQFLNASGAWVAQMFGEAE
jgi:hypothetical protein